MPLDAVLLEFDGVLAETAEARRDALLRALAEEGFSPSPSEAAALDPYAVPSDVARSIARERGTAADETAVELVTLRARRHFGERAARGLALAPGAAPLVRQLAARARLAVVSASARGAVELILQLSDLEGLVTVTSSAEDGATPPAPDLLAHAIARLDRARPVRAAGVLALCGTSAGLLAATRAGVRAVAVGAMPAHEAMRAAAYVPSLDGMSADALLHLAGIAPEPVP
jgi:beta-phosphoglucomutase-like phosphatase (HAD superfamily)